MNIAKDISSGAKRIVSKCLEKAEVLIDYKLFEINSVLNKYKTLKDKRNEVISNILNWKNIWPLNKLIDQLQKYWSIEDRHKIILMLLRKCFTEWKYSSAKRLVTLAKNEGINVNTKVIKSEIKKWLEKLIIEWLENLIFEVGKLKFKNAILYIEQENLFTYNDYKYFFIMLIGLLPESKPFLEIMISFFSKNKIVNIDFQSMLIILFNSWLYSDEQELNSSIDILILSAKKRKEEIDWNKEFIIWLMSYLDKWNMERIDIILLALEQKWLTIDYWSMVGLFEKALMKCIKDLKFERFVFLLKFIKDKNIKINLTNICTEWLLKSSTDIDIDYFIALLTKIEEEGGQIDYSLFNIWLSKSFIRAFKHYDEQTLQKIINFVNSRGINIDFNLMLTKVLAWRIENISMGGGNISEIVSVIKKFKIKIDYQSLRKLFVRKFKLIDWMYLENSNFEALLFIASELNIPIINRKKLIKDQLYSRLQSEYFYNDEYIISLAKSEGIEINLSEIIIQGYNKALRNWSILNFMPIIKLAYDNSIVIDFKWALEKWLLECFRYWSIDEIENLFSLSKDMNINIDLSLVFAWGFRKAVDDKNYIIALRILKYAKLKRLFEKSGISSQEIENVLKLAKNGLDISKTEKLREFHGRVDIVETIVMFYSLQWLMHKLKSKIDTIKNMYPNEINPQWEFSSIRNRIELQHWFIRAEAEIRKIFLWVQQAILESTFSRRVNFQFQDDIFSDYELYDNDFLFCSISPEDVRMHMIWLRNCKDIDLTWKQISSAWLMAWKDDFDIWQMMTTIDHSFDLQHHWWIIFEHYENVRRDPIIENEILDLKRDVINFKDWENWLIELLWRSHRKTLNKVQEIFDLIHKIDKMAIQRKWSE